MTVRLEYTKAHHLSTLHDELNAAGFAPTLVEGGYPDKPFGLALEFPDGFADEAGVEAVVLAHNRAAALAAWQAARDAEADEDSQAAAFLGQLDTAIAEAQAAGTLTAAQVKAGLLLALRASRILIRYELRKRGA